MANHLNRAIELVQQAIDEDVQQNYPEAYKQYQNSLDYFTLAFKDEKNDKSKRLLQSKIDEYRARAEILRRHLAGEGNDVNEVSRDKMVTSRPPSHNSLDRAIELVRRAIDEDVKQNYPEAYRQYQNAVDHFLLALKYEKNDYSRRLIWSKMNEYVTRAERLKQYYALTGMLI